MDLLSSMARYTPHGFCLAWEPGLVWTLAISDLLVAAAYFSIPAALVVFARRRTDLAFRPVFGLFAAFILFCGTTHAMGALTLWVPAYGIEAVINVVTAILSVATAAMLWPLLPKALALPSPAALRALNAALAHEVEERSAAAQALMASEARQKRLYERTPAALHAIDAEGKLIEVSDRWLELTGYARAEVIGRPLRDFYDAESADRSAAQIAALQSGEAVPTGELRFCRKDGAMREIEAVLEPEYDADGRLQRVLAALTDVTARNQTTKALRAAEERLHQSQKMEAVGQLTGGIAHDFNNLLTTIMGSLELLQQRATLDDRCKRLVANALQGSDRAARLTSQLLSFSRRQRLAPEALVVAEVIAGIGDLLARSLGDGVSLDVTVPAETWALTADRNQLESALLNLVLNARDAMGGSGAVRIAARNITIGVNPPDPDGLPPGDYVSVTVSDTGAGMTDEVKPRIFEPFFTTKAPGAGTGLGLSQTYGFVTQSGGTVRVESAPGQGATLEIILPRALGQTMTVRTPDVRPGETRAHGEHILLVEDDALLRQTLAEALLDRGYRVSAAADGTEALRLLADKSVSDIALLFTDMIMPGLSGVELALRARAVLPEVPVIFASGYSPASLLAAWPEQPDFLSKPYTAAAAASRIAARLGTGRAVETA